MNIEHLFKEKKEPVLGVYNFLPDKLNEIKQTEVQTYSMRAKDFHLEKVKNLNEKNRALLNPFREFQKKESVFLEIGGGDARFAISLMQDGYNVIESDIAIGSVTKAREMIKMLNLEDNCSFLAADGESLPFKDKVLDGVFIIAALHHMPDPQKALNEMYRVTKDNGKVLILREPASWQYYVFYPLYVTIRQYIRKKNKNRPISLADDKTFGFSKSKLTKMLKKAGFTQIKFKPVHYTAKFYTNWIILKSKIKLKYIKPNKNIEKFFTKTDKIIEKIPFLNLMTWDWDIEVTK